jgi:hypothetical protein
MRLVRDGWEVEEEEEGGGGSGAVVVGAGEGKEGVERHGNGRRVVDRRWIVAGEEEGDGDAAWPTTGRRPLARRCIVVLLLGGSGRGFLLSSSLVFGLVLLLYPLSLSLSVCLALGIGGCSVRTSVVCRCVVNCVREERRLSA